MDLIKFALAIEERVLGNHLEEDAAIAPDVHLGVIVAVGHEALGSPVPAGRDVFGVGLLGVDA